MCAQFFAGIRLLGTLCGLEKKGPFDTTSNGLSLEWGDHWNDRPRSWCPSLHIAVAKCCKQLAEIVLKHGQIAGRGATAL